MKKRSETCRRVGLARRGQVGESIDPRRDGRWTRVLAAALLATSFSLDAAAGSGGTDPRFLRSPRPLRGSYLVVLENEAATKATVAAFSPRVAALATESARPDPVAALLESYSGNDSMRAQVASYLADNRVAEIYLKMPESEQERLQEALDREVREVSASVMGSLPGRIESVCTAAVGVKGFVARMTEEAARALSRDRRVRRVEEDTLLSFASVRRDVPWGLDRVDERSRKLDGRFDSDSTGRGVIVYIVDSGIDTSRDEFLPLLAKGKILPGYGVVSEPYKDEVGHGTLVAKIAAGAVTGVAPDAMLVSVNVAWPKSTETAPGVPSASTVWRGLDWILRDPEALRRGRPVVINESFGVEAGFPRAPSTFANWDAGRQWDWIFNWLLETGELPWNWHFLSWEKQNEIIEGWRQTLLDNSALVAIHVAIALIEKIPLVIAAGNDGVDACDVFPAQLGEVPAGGVRSGYSVITVGASDDNDERVRSSWYVAGDWDSNWGRCVSLFAPGKDVLGFWAGGSGTSVSAPFVTGAVANILQVLPSLNAYDVKELILRRATSGTLAGETLADSPNLLLYAPVRGSQELAGGGLEGAWWSGSRPGLIHYDPSGAREGYSYAKLGGLGTAHTDTLTYTGVPVVPPPTAIALKLSFWLKVDSAETGTTIRDVLRVKVRNERTGNLSTWMTFSNLDKKSGWVQVTKTVPWSGDSGLGMSIVLEAVEDSANATTFRIDDLKVEVWR